MATFDAFCDNFESGAISNKWQISNSQYVYVTSNALYVGHAATSSYQDLTLATAYDLTGNAVYVQILDRGNQALTSHEVIFALFADASNEVWFTMSGNNISAYKKVATVSSQIGSMAYSAATMEWLRIRESAGTTYFDTSPDGVTWTNRWNLGNPITMTALYLMCQSGCWQNEASGSYGLFDNVNLPPKVGFTPHVTVGEGMSRNEWAS